MQRTAPVLFFLTAFSCGCVMKQAHNETVADNLRLASELSSIKKERDEMKNKLAETEKKISSLETRNEELSNTNQMLVGKNSDYARKSSEDRQELIKVKEEKAKSEEKSELAAKTYDDLVKTLKDEIAAGEIKVAQRGDRLAVNLSDRILFPSGSEKIQPEGGKILKKIAGVLKDVKDKRIEVEGHTDAVKITGALRKQFPSNWELSTARATKVVRFLEENGVDPAKLAAVGYGQHRPVADNATPAGRALNRRIEIVLAPASSARPK